MARRKDPWAGMAWNAWAMGLEASTVIGLRTLKIAAGGAAVWRARRAYPAAAAAFGRQEAFEVDGRITADELDGLYTHIFEVSQPDSPLKILVRMKRYDGFAPAILADPKIVERKLSLLHRVSRYAIVGGPDWLATLVKLFDPLFRIELRHFPLDSEDAARAWLSEGGDEGR